MVDWQAIFVPSLSLAEVVVRGTIVYLSLFLMLRLLPRRQAGQWGPTDLLVIVLIADAIQNGMSSDYTSITEGLTLVGTILSWSILIDWLDDRFPHLNLASAPPLLLIKNGQLIKKNLRKEAVSEEELMSQLRQQGIDDIAKVKAAHIEGDGHFSVITHDR